MATVWIADAPPTLAGSLDDEFADASGGLPSGWSESDHGSNTTVSEDEHGLIITQATHAGSTIAGVYKTRPVDQDFTVWSKLCMTGISDTSSLMVGLAMWEDAANSAGDLRIFSLTSASNDFRMEIESWTSYTTFASEQAVATTSLEIHPSHIYMRIRYTHSTTTYSFDYSTNGIGWQQLYSTAALGIVPLHIGIFVNNVASGVDMAVRVPFFRSVASDVGLTGRVDGKAETLAIANSNQVSAWMADMPPTTPGSLDDEFQDNSGGIPSGWTEVDHGTHQTVTEDISGLVLSQATHVGESVSGVYKAHPGADFTAWTKVSVSGLGETNAFTAGIAIWENATAATGNILFFGLLSNATNQALIGTAHTQWDATGTDIGSADGLTVDAGCTFLYLRVRYTHSSTTYSFDYSTDGLGWVFHDSEVQAGYTHLGPAMNNVASGNTVKATYAFFRSTNTDVGNVGTAMRGNRARLTRA